jgi:transcriptional regulator with XRE-family HTH domain
MNPIDKLRTAATQPDPWKLRCLRELQRLTQREVAAKCGFSDGNNKTVMRLESYAITFGALRCSRMAVVFDVGESTLLSSPAEWETNRATYKRWRDEGAPTLSAWLANDASR